MDNIFINHGSNGRRFSDIQLGDCGGVVSCDSKFAEEGHFIGAGISRSPEVILEIGWGTPTDIWSFGNAVRFISAHPPFGSGGLNTLASMQNIANVPPVKIISLIYGGDYHMFNPANEDVALDDELYPFVTLRRMYRVFGPFPQTFEDFAGENPNLLTIINVLHEYGPPEKPFKYISRMEVSPADKIFLLKIMKLDPRDRPTARQLLQDEWFTEESEDTRMPLEEYYEVIRRRNEEAKTAREAAEATKRVDDEGPDIPVGSANTASKET